MAQLRVLTKSGNKLFSSWIEAAKQDPRSDPPCHILKEDTYSMLFDPAIEVSRIVASTRYEVGEFLHDELAEVPKKDLLHNVGLWSWLSLFNIDILAPVVAKKRKVAAANRLIFDAEDFGGYYRHLLRGAWGLIDHHKSDPSICKAILSSSPNVGSEIYEQIGSRKRLRYSAAVLETVNELYFDDARNKLKKGVTNYKKSGTIRRLVHHIEQFRKTYNLNAADKNTLLSLLPEKEYSRWKQ
jgi:hypothetical protein